MPALLALALVVGGLALAAVAGRSGPAEAPPTARTGTIPAERSTASAPASAEPAPVAPPAAAQRAPVASPPHEPIRWRRSRAIGLPYAGRLVNGVRLPAEGRHFSTWDPVRKRSPNRAWRRWGTDRLVRTTLRIVAAYAAAHPPAPRVAIGDLSRPRGGDFGRRFGGIGHASHQNGLDVDVYYPRKDGRERSPKTVAQVDRRLAQDLVDRFVAAGAVKVFVGPNVRLAGPRRVVQPLPHHDNHLHVRLAPRPR
jgi:murein endopeptidase